MSKGNLVGLRFSILHHRCIIHKQQLGYNQFPKA